MPRARQVLTEAAIAGLAPPAKGRIEVFDALVPGFGIRVSAAGRRSWIVMYRLGSRQRRATLGSHPALTLTRAREQAREIKIMAAQGFDPARALIGLDLTESENSFAAVAHLFIETHAKKKNRHWRETKRIFDVYVIPDKPGEGGGTQHRGWGGRAVPAITSRDVAALIEHVEACHGPVMANRVLAAIRKFFSWCLEEGGNLAANPVLPGMSRAGEKKRAGRRRLSEDEIRGLWAAAEILGWPFGSFIEMLLLTGQPRGEVAAMRWSDVENGLWRGPRQDVPLTPLALEILARMPRLGDHVFTTNRRDDKPLAGFSQAKARCDEQFKPDEPWTMRDLRGTVREHISEIGPGQKGALEAWADKLQSILARKK